MVETLQTPIIRSYVYVELELPFDYADPKSEKYKTLVDSIVIDVSRVSNISPIPRPLRQGQMSIV